ncbi:MAG: hypothetical protein QE269_06270 [Fimbriimonas sp.]|jgi:hypothetical protein|nr:hypothetical protein [Fimbriimonas sp.]
MKNVIAISAVLVLTLGATSFAQQKKADNQKDIIKATRWLSGTVTGFETGDYLHALVKDSKGQERSFFIGGGGTDYFLALHKGKKLRISYQVVSSYIHEAGGRQEIERINSAKFGNLESGAWWKAQRKKYSFEELDKKYTPLIYKAK